MDEIENKIEQLTFNQLIMTASEFNNELMRLIKLVEESQIDNCCSSFNGFSTIRSAPRVSQQLNN